LSEDSNIAAVAASLHRRVQQSLVDNLVLTPAGRREAEARAREAERERRAQLPPPRDVLREAHARLAEAEGEAARLGEAAERASEHRRSVAERRARIANTIEAEGEAAAADLIAELTGSDRPLASDLGDGIATSAALAAADRELAIADLAVAQLDEQLAEASRKRTAAAVAVRRAACNLLLQHAAKWAERLHSMESAILSARDGLDALSRVITDAQRAETVRPAWPARIGQAINPLEPPRAARATAELLAQWRDTLAELMRDPETRPDLDPGWEQSASAQFSV
jgi:hypothetical protein